MKVLVLPSWYPDEKNKLNGVFFKEQVEALKRRDIDIVVLSINIINIKNIFNADVKSGLKISKENGVTVYRYYTYNYFPRLTELYLKYYAKIIDRIIPLIQRDEGIIDLVHIHSAIDGGIAYSISKSEIPYLITEHSSKYQRNLLNKVQIKYLKKVFSEAKEVIAVGEGLKDAIKKYSGKREILVIPNMLSLIKGSQPKDNSKNKFRFFSLGLLTKTKGMDLLIDAFNNNKDKLENCELYIGGDGEEREALKLKIVKNGLEDKVHLLGKLDRDKVAYHMSNCDAFVLASRFETFGIVFLEAMTYGKPVIGSKTGGPDTFINDKNGILVNVEDVEGLGESMVRMYNDISLYNSEYIENYCNNNFSEKVICDRIIEVYDNIYKNL